MKSVKKIISEITLFLFFLLVASIVVNISVNADNSIEILNDVESVFYISKSDNGNQAHYRINLNSECEPVGKNPIDVYWQMEDGTVEDLLKIEEPAYGVENQIIQGNTVTVEINGFKSRNIQKQILIETFKSNSKACQAKASASINNKNTQLLSAYITLSNVKIFLGRTVGGKIESVKLIGKNEDQETILCRSNCTFGL